MHLMKNLRALLGAGLALSISACGGGGDATQRATSLGAVVGVWGPIQASRKGPRDWRLALMWVSWGLAVAVAVGGVIEESRAIEAGEQD